MSRRISPNMYFARFVLRKYTRHLQQCYDRAHRHNEYRKSIARVDKQSAIANYRYHVQKLRQRNRRDSARMLKSKTEVLFASFNRPDKPNATRNFCKTCACDDSRDLVEIYFQSRARRAPKGLSGTWMCDYRGASMESARAERVLRSARRRR